MEQTSEIKTHVMIIGGGIAGSMAAIAAARMHVSVVLVEEKGCLGGSLTCCGTGPMMTFHAGEKQVIRGIADEVIQRLKAKGLSPGHIPDSTGYTYTVTPFDSEGLKRELEVMCIESGVEILYHTVLSSVSLTDKTITHLDLLSCGVHLQATAQVFIDASGDADLLFQSGVPTMQGREEDGKDQPLTMNFKLDHVDIDQIRDLMDREVTLFPLLQKKAGLEKTAERISCSGFEAIMQKGREDGAISFDRKMVLFFETNTPNQVIVNMTRIKDINPVDPFQLSYAEREGRRQVWEIFDFIKKHVPGFDRAELLLSGPNIGVRSSRRLQGVYTLTIEDVLSGRKFSDGIALCGYPVDIHSCDTKDNKTVFLSDGSYYSLPYRCFVTPKLTNCLATGRIVSATFEAQASLRVSPMCAAMGQATGVAAALCVKNQVNTLQLDTNQLRQKLVEQGAMVE